MYVCMYVRNNYVQKHVCMHVRMYTHKHTHTHTHTRTYTCCTYMYIQIYMFNSAVHDFNYGRVEEIRSKELSSIPADFQC